MAQTLLERSLNIYWRYNDSTLYKLLRSLTHNLQLYSLIISCEICGLNPDSDRSDGWFRRRESFVKSLGERGYTLAEIENYGDMYEAVLG